MPALIPFFFLASVFGALYRRKTLSSDWREVFLTSLLVFGITVTLLTELLSVFRLLEFGFLLPIWAGLAALGLVVCLKGGGASGWERLAPARIRLASLSGGHAALMMSLIVLPALIAITGWTSAPNNWDSMTYHLVRVAHWTQNETVAHYPTSIVRQSSLSPWAEFAMTHLSILSGGDRLAWLVQWFSMMSCIIGVSLVAAQLGAGRLGQVLAAAFCVSLPMGILQASSTQNDYVAALWLVCAAHLVVGAVRNGLSTQTGCLLGVAAGLSILTKGTAYVFLFPLLLWLLCSQVKKRGWGNWRPLVAVAFIAAALNTPFYLRNIELSGSPLGSVGVYPNRTLSPRLLASNLLRNLALHGVTPWPQLNAVLDGGVRGVHRLLRVDTNHPATTFPGTRFVLPAAIPSEGPWTGRPALVVRHEDHAGNLLHLLLIGCVVSCILVRRDLKRERIPTRYLVSVTGMFVLFCLVFRWQPWHVRLHLPIFVLWAPLIGWGLGALGRAALSQAACLVLVLASLPWVFGNTLRPWSGDSSIFRVERQDQYLGNKPHLIPQYRRAVDRVLETRASKVGLVLGADSGEYPLWVFLKGSDAAIRIEHVGVTNYPARSRPGVFIPDLILALDRPMKELEIENRLFVRTWSSGPFSLLVPE